MKTRLASFVAILSMMVLCMLLAPAVQAQHKVAFVTSVSGDGNLGDATEWPDNGGFTGLAAADNVCRMRATAAGLSHPGHFVAWLSSSTDDAYCRVHGLAGKKVSNCGQGTLPVDAGPWVRTDGASFADSIDRAVAPNHRIYRPIALNEHGSQVGAYKYHFTATDSGGSVEPGRTCTDWSDSSGFTNIGSVRGTIETWTNVSSSECSIQRRLLCLEANGSGPSLPRIPEEGAGVFLSSLGGTGDLELWPEAGGAQGLAAGDAICQTLAANAGRHAPDSYVAWLSDASENAIDRITGDGPWVRPDGVMVAVDKGGLSFEPAILSTINVTETYRFELDRVFTGTAGTGYGLADHCGNWTNGVSGNGETGYAGHTHHAWTQNAHSPCSEASRLYCFSNSTSWPFFANGFESGDLEWWSTVAGN